MLYYLDASVWVMRYFDELGTQSIRALFHGEHSLTSSWLGLIEVMATATRKCAAGAIDSAALLRIKTQLAQNWRTFVRVELDAEVGDRALEVAGAFGLRGSDSVHLASASSPDCPSRLPGNIY